MKFRLLITTMMVFVGFATASHASQRQPTLSANGQPLRMDVLKVHVDVVGNLATTAMTMTFRNDTNRVLQGELVFPLQEGQEVSGYALDINGKMRDAVVVEKNKGRKVFESIVRRGVDPGLLEKTAGNNYRTRVYPIPARGTRTVRVVYESVLKATERGQEYVLPLALKSQLSAFDLNVIVHQEKQQPKAEGNYIEFDKAGSNYTATLSRKNYQANATLKFWLPIAASKQAVSTRYENNGDGFHYYTAQLPYIPKITAANAWEKVVLYWDVSASAADTDHAKVFATLKQLLKQKQFPKKIELVTFSHAIHSRETVDISSSIKPLIGTLKSLDYDGGTQLGTLDLASKAEPNQLNILVTDGVSNFGKAEPKLSENSARTLLINAQLTAEHARLRHIARETSGWYINLNKLTIAEAMTKFGAKPSRVVASIDNDQRADVLTRVDNGHLTVVVRHVKVGETLTINVNDGEVLKVLPLPRANQASDTEQLSRHWAQKKIAELEMNAQKNRSAIIAIGKDYGVVSRFTSMLVLEQISDYVANDIEPPAELMAEYTRLKNQQKQQATEQTNTHLNNIANLYQKEIDWWKKTFTQPRKRRQSGPGKSAGGAPPRDRMDTVFHSTTSNSNADQSVMRPAPSPVIAESTEEEEPEEEAAGDRYVGAFGVDVSTVAEAGEASDSPQLELSVVQAKNAVGGQRGSNAVLANKPKIKLKKWDPKTPYLDALRSTDKELAYAKYLVLKKDYANSSAFFLDVADFFRENEDKKTALRVLSNIAELKLENHRLLRIMAYRLQQLGYHTLAIETFKVVKELRPEEPQSWRDLGLAYERTGQQQLAADMLWHVVSNTWDGRFPNIQVIALYEVNRILDRNTKLDSSFIPKQLHTKMRKALPVDLRVVMTWDADVTDIDLWVTDPFGEKCYYSNANTRAGGRMSSDITGGYGPEVFLMKKAFAGNYKVEANYYGNRQQTLAGATTVQLEFITNWGKADEHRESVTLRLKDKKESVLVGEFTIK